LHVVPGVDPVHASCIAQAGYSQEVSLWNYCHVSHCKWRSFILERQYQLTEIIITWSHGHLHPIIFLQCWAEEVLCLCLVLLKGWCIWPRVSSHQQLKTWPEENKVPWENCKTPGGLPKTREKPWNSSLDKT
jgi:hypothetical protein